MQFHPRSVSFHHHPDSSPAIPACHPGFSAIQGYGRARRSAGKSGAGRTPGLVGLALLLGLSLSACDSDGPAALPTGGEIAPAAKGGKGGVKGVEGRLVLPLPNQPDGLYSFNAWLPATISAAGIVVTPACEDAENIRLTLTGASFPSPDFPPAPSISECGNNRLSVDLPLDDLVAMPNGASVVAGSPVGGDTQNFSDNSYYFFIRTVEEVPVGKGGKTKAVTEAWNLVWDAGVTVTRTAGSAGETGGSWTITATGAQSASALLVERESDPSEIEGPFDVALDATLTIP